MRVIDLDATNWKSVLDFCDALLAALGAPEWHGTSIDAFIDSMVWGGINEVEIPFKVRIFGTSQLPIEVRDYVELFKHALAAACVDFRNRQGHDVGLQFETYP